MASGTVKAAKSNIYNLGINQYNSTGITTDGEIVSFSIGFSVLNWDSIELKFFELRLKNVSNNVNPVITIECPELTKIGNFYYMFSSALRGSAGSPIASNGGAISHAANENKITVNFFDYIGSKPAGYIHITR